VAATKAKSKSSAIIKANPAKETEFSHTNWGEAADGYLLSIRNSLSNGKRFEDIINKAKSIAKKNKKKDIMGRTPSDQNGNERGLLKDDTDSDD
jgi:hypothetical protein